MTRSFGPVGSMVAAVLLAASAVGQDLTGGIPEEVQAELGYAEWLQEQRLPEFADIIIERVRREYPAAGALIKVLKLRSLTARGHWAEVEALIEREPNQNSQEAWAMRLALADGYYAWGKFNDAEAIYDSLFKQFPEGPPEALNDFFIDSAYRFAKMKLNVGDRVGALAAYEALQKAKLPAHVTRQVSAEMGDTLLQLAAERPEAERKTLLAKVEKIANDLLWIQDVWFGKGIVLLAHTHMLRGNVEGAMKLVDDYRPELRQIDTILREQAEETGDANLTQLSPMAEVRYLMGVMLQEEAQRLMAQDAPREQIVPLLAGKDLGDNRRSSGALQHFLNVFIGFPATSWAPEAGQRAERIEALLVDRFGATIKKNVTRERLEEVRRYQFQNARALFNSHQYVNAAEAYIKVLNLFPEGETSVAALGELARCYIEMEEAMFCEVTTRYIAERFSGDEQLLRRAGDQVLRVADTYAERGDMARQEAYYTVFFDAFERHPMASSLLLMFGNRYFQAGNYTQAAEYFERVAASYTNTASYLPALRGLTFCHAKAEEPVKEIKALERYAKALEAQRRPGSALIEARFRQAVTLQKLGGRYLTAAYNRYRALIELIQKNDPRYEANEEDVAKNQSVLEGSRFYMAVALSQFTTPEERLKQFKQLAIRTLNDLIKANPKSKFAPAALSQIGTLWTILDNPKEAEKALRKLQNAYPESIEARNALYTLGSNLLQLGMRERAIEVFREMFSGEGTYSSAQVLTAGNELMDAGEAEIALQAFDRVLAAEEGRNFREPALLGRGRALLALEDFSTAAKVLTDAQEAYPRSGYSVDRAFLLSRAYAELAMREPDETKRVKLFNDAIKAMRTVRLYDETPAGMARSNLEVGRIELLRAEAERQYGEQAKVRPYIGRAVAAFQSLMMYGDAGNAEVRPFLDDAFGLCLPLMLEMELWADVVKDADRYLQLFPNGNHAREIRRLRSRATTSLVLSGRPGDQANAAADGVATEPEEEAPGEEDTDESLPMEDLETGGE